MITVATQTCTQAQQMAVCFHNKHNLGNSSDYWVKYGSSAADPYIGNWTEHTYGESTGDYTGTNQSTLSSTDGSTTFYDDKLMQRIQALNSIRMDKTAFSTASLDDEPDENLKRLNSHKAEYLLISGFAVAYHGYPRATGDYKSGNPWKAGLF